MARVRGHSNRINDQSGNKVLLTVKNCTNDIPEENNVTTRCIECICTIKLPHICRKPALLNTRVLFVYSLLMADIYICTAMCIKHAGTR